MTELVGHLERLRDAELEAVRDRFRPDLRVLEVGGGSGYQAARIAAWGCRVTSVDLEGRPPLPVQHFPVQPYDGRRLPFADGSFDLVFSSNVLEHMPALDAALAEMRRVLAPGGLMVHVVPSASWRLSTSLAYYPFLLRYLLGFRAVLPGVTETPSVSGVIRRRGLAYALRRAVVPNPHGTSASALVELYDLSRFRWRRTFAAAGLRTVAEAGCGLFYTGYGLMPGLRLAVRRCLARVFGSACRIYVLAGLGTKGLVDIASPLQR